MVYSLSWSHVKYKHHRPFLLVLIRFKFLRFGYFSIEYYKILLDACNIDLMEVDLELKNMHNLYSLKNNHCYYCTKHIYI